MEKKVLIIIFSVILISFTPQVFAEDELDTLLAEKNGVLIEQQTIIFEVGKHSDVHVKHVIETGQWNEDRPRIIGVLSGVHSGLTVVDEDGDRLNFSYDGKTFEESKFIILNQKLGNYDLIVEYNLDDFLELENGLWQQHILYPFDVMIMFEDDIGFIFVNSRPVDVHDVKGINCMGCEMTLDFFHDEKIIKKEISTTKENFEMEIISNNEISEIEFIEGGTQLLNFNVKDKDQLFILKIPFRNFLNPYDVYFTDKDDTSLDQLDKIRKTEFNQDDQFVSVSFRTSTEGIVSILGATPEEHQKRLEQIKKMKEREIASEIIKEEKKGLALPIPGTKAASELAAQMNERKDGEEIETLSFADELKQGQTQNSENDITIIGIIAGIIVAGIIGGVVLKLKKK